MHSVMTGIFDKYIEVMTDALSTFLKTIDFVQTPDWDAFVNEIIGKLMFWENPIGGIGVSE